MTRRSPSEALARTATLRRPSPARRVSSGRSSELVTERRVTDQPEPILERVARQEPGAVDEMMSRFGGLVWSLARRTCSDPTEAEDAVQEIFVEIWRTAHRFDSSIAGEATFVAMIARRRLIDRTRRKTRRPQSVALQESAPDPTPIDDSTEIREQAGVASVAFEKLRPEQQQVLRLAIHHGRSHEQIATTTGMPLGTVKTHARRGLIKLRQLLEADGFEMPQTVGSTGGKDQ
jgi:RNA polymerase sigma factor (sigma-70 family)